MANRRDINRWNKGGEHWNKWAKRRLKARKKLEGEGKWEVDENGDGLNEVTKRWIKYALVDFSNYKFKKSAGFANFIFPHIALFSDARFEKNAEFGGAVFFEDAGFRGVTFSGGSWFGEATFLKDAWFQEGTFSGSTWFENATFSGKAVFSGATFNTSALAWFDQATFTGEALFESVTFSNTAWFRRATFNGVTKFGETSFRRDAWFGEATFHGHLEFVETTFSRRAWFYEATFSEYTEFVLSKFEGHAVFDEAKFLDGSSFRSSKSTGSLSFANTHFAQVPDFITVQYGQVLRLDNVYVPEPTSWDRGDKENSARFRALKALAIEAHDHERELNFFAGELKSQRFTIDKPLGNGWPNFWTGIFYELLSDFGRSIALPLGWLAATVIIFTATYGTNVSQAWRISCGWASNFPPELYLSLVQSLPVFGLFRGDKRYQALQCLFGPVSITDTKPNVSPLMDLLFLGQNTFSIILIFFCLLAIRNHFRIK